MAKYITLRVEDEAFEQLKLRTKHSEVWLGSPTANRTSNIATNVSLFVKLTDWINENQTIPTIFLQCWKRLYKIASVEQNTEVCYIHITKVLDHAR